MPASSFTDPLTDPARELERLQRRLRSLSLLRGGGVAAITASTAILAVLSADGLWVLPASARAGCLAGLGMLLAAVCGRLLWGTLRGRLGPAELAALVEDAYPHFHERLLTTIELDDPRLPEADKGSPFLRERLRQQTRALLAGIDVGRSVPVRPALNTALWGAAALAALLLPLLLSGGYRLLWSRLLQPWGNLETAGNLYFEVEGGDRIVARGSDADILARPQFRYQTAVLPEAVHLHGRHADGQPFSRRMQWDESGGVYRARLPNVIQPLSFHVAAGRTRSRDYRLEVAEAPEIAALAVHVQPPPYTGWPAVRHDGVVGEMRVFEGSALTLDLRCSKPVVTADWRFAEADGPDEAVQQPFQLADDRVRGSLAFTAVRGGRFQIHLTDEYGLRNLAQPERRLTIVRDQPPALQLAAAADTQAVRPDDVVPLSVTARDDIALAALEVHVEMIGTDGPPRVLAAEPARLGGAELAHEFALPLADWGLAEGAALRYRIRAADNRPKPGPNETWSRPRLLLIRNSAAPPGAAELAERHRQLQEQLVRIRDDLEESRRRVEALEQVAAADPQQLQSQQAQLQRESLADAQRDLAERAEQLAERFQEHPLLDELSEQSRAVGRENLAPSAEQLDRAGHSPPQQTAQQLQQAAENLAEADERLERMVERFEELAALERDLLELDQLALRAEQLARRAAALAPEPAAQPGERRQIDQDRRQLADQLDDLLDRRPELIAAARRQELERLSELARRAEEIARLQELLAEALQTEADAPVAASRPQPTPTAGSETAGSPASDPAQSHSDGRRQEDTGPASPQDAATARPTETSPSNDVAGESARETQFRQMDLAAEAAELARQAARQRGAQSAETQSAAHAARDAAEAARQALAGRLDAAAQAAQRAAHALEHWQRAEHGSPVEPRQQPSPWEQAQQWARQQRAAAEQFRRQADSPAQRREAQAAGQQRLAQVAEQLSRECSQCSERLATTPLDDPRAAAGAQSAAAAAHSARQAMQQASARLFEGAEELAAGSARRAAEDMHRAAGAARAAAGNETAESPIPGEVGRQVAEAARNLHRAGQQLGAGGSAQPAAPPSETNAHAANPSAGSPQAGNSPAPGERDPAGQHDPAGESTESVSRRGGASASAGAATQALQAAAQQLAQAASQSLPGRAPPQRQAAFGEPSQAGSLSEAGAGAGWGGQVPPEFAELEAQLRQMSVRQWGRLPGQLDTEILQSARRKPSDDYARLIKLYFEEVARESTKPR